MSKAKVTLVDYGVGNLLNVARALEHVGAQVDFADKGSAIATADRVVLPGVGAFPDGMRELNERGFAEQLRAFAGTGRPMMGICLGMQMLLDSSSEFGHTDGLGLIPGKVAAIPPVGVNGTKHKIPHTGWNSLVPATGLEWQGEGLFGRLPVGTAMYFVHSFMAIPDEPGHRLANYDYDGLQVCAAVRLGNLYGCQFHPEKSGEYGLEVLRSFLRL